MTFVTRTEDLPLPKTIAESIAHIVREDKVYPTAGDALASGPHPHGTVLRVAADQASKPTNPKDAIGIKKAPLSTVPMGVVAECGVAMLEGASKYGRHNYRAVGVRASVYFDATMRHLLSWWEGQNIDPDSGLSHITKAIVSLIVLRDAQMQGKCTDDRPPVSEEFYTLLNELAAEILEKHKDKSPHHYTIGDDV